MMPSTDDPAHVPTYGEAEAAFIASQLRDREPRISARDIHRIMRDWHGLPSDQRRLFTFERDESER